MDYSNGSYFRDSNTAPFKGDVQDVISVPHNHTLGIRVPKATASMDSISF